MDKTHQEWLQATLNQGDGELSDDDIFALLSDPSLDEDSLSEGISFVQTWLSKKAIIPIFQIITSPDRSALVRSKAADALVQILDEETLNFIRHATNSDSPPL
jgi:HEAT repeat protein